MVDQPRYPHADVTREIIASAFAVHKVLGYGFLESVYRRAMAIELRRRGVNVQEEVRYDVDYLGEWAGTYRADLVAEDAVIVELKTGLLPDPVGPALTLNYMKASRLTVGLFITFGTRVTFKRVVYTSAPEEVPLVANQ